MNLAISDAACEFIKKQIAKENGTGLRLSIKKTGCSGYAYQVEIIDKICANDFHVEPQPAVKIYVDVKWMHLLDGIKIDYIEENKLGLKQKKLIFVNDKEGNRCGCGESFHIE